MSTATEGPVTTMTGSPTAAMTELSDPTSQEFQERAQRTRTELEKILKGAFSASFISLIVRNFRSGSIITTADLTFSSTNAPAVDTIASAVTNAVQADPTGLNIIPTSIKVTDPGATTMAPTTTLAASVVVVFDVIYKARYGPRFIRTIVIAFRAVSRTRVEQDTEAEVELEFNETSSEPLPSTNDITTTLTEAVNNPSNNFSISIDPESITILRVVHGSRILELEFTSSDTFVPDLLNPNSSAFIFRAQITKQQIDPVFRDAFTSFFNYTVSSFRSGSVITTGDLAFNASEPSPNTTEVGLTLRNAVLNGVVQLGIDPDSIKVNGTAVVTASGGVSAKLSLFTASFVAVTSLLLTHLW
ncbi:hypothetical protein AGOR_G00232290 [Albula goreensis]|uniref:SEA domain-containing protein n=1 Tax=Albula goreensis TaxID=1534307 RepID=A0A8T3CI78_9TELE|nr:hypothetical protein AGOR_G00232290 [Albula goreensis]